MLNMFGGTGTSNVTSHSDVSMTTNGE